MFWNIKIGVTKESVGHAGLNIMLYLDSQTSKPDMLIVFYSKKVAHNEIALKLMVKHLQKYQNIKLINSHIISRIINRLSLTKWFKYIFKHIFANIYMVHNSDKYLAYGSPYNIWHENSKQIECKLEQNILQNFEIIKDQLGIFKKYVCVFTRDQKFYKDDHDGKIRNTDFRDLDITINYLLRNDYQVVRIGRNHVKDNYKSEEDGYIDLEESVVYVDPNLVDVLLIKNCEFILGNNSGLNMIAFLFNKPVLLHNYFPIGLRPIYKYGSYICRKYIRNNKVIPYYKIPKNLLLSESASLLQKHNITLKKNTSTEILEFVKNQIKGNFTSTVNPNHEQIIYGGPSGFDDKWYITNKNLFR